MRASLSLAIFLGLVPVLFGASPVRAQDDAAPPANAPAVNTPPVAAPAQNPPADNLADTPPAGNPADAQPAPNQNGAAATQKDRSAERRAQNEGRLRAMLKDFGVQDAPAQDALIAYIAEDETGKNTVRGAARRLMFAVRMGATPERMRDLIAIYKAAIDAEGERRRAAQNALDAKIGFSLNPRLEATLWLLGVLGENQNGMLANGANARPPRKPNFDGNARDRDNNGRNNNGRADNRDKGARDNNVRRGGTVRGSVSRKGEGWIEVVAEDGSIDTYWSGPENGVPATAAIAAKTTIAPTERALTAPPTAAFGVVTTTTAKDETARQQMVSTLQNTKIGAKVRLDWVWNGRKCVTHLEDFSLEKTALATAPPAPKTNDAAP